MKVESRPWFPVKYTDYDASLITALHYGRASPNQQTEALKFIVEKVCGYYDLSYRAGEDGRRDTDFAEGKRFVGAQLVKLTKIPLTEKKE